MKDKQALIRAREQNEKNNIENESVITLYISTLSFTPLLIINHLFNLVVGLLNTIKENFERFGSIVGGPQVSSTRCLFKNVACSGPFL